MRVLVLTLAWLLAAAPAHAQSPLLGLLTLPRVFGEGACDPTPPRPVALFDGPRGARIGEIRTLTPWRMNPEGGCEMLEVRVLLGAQRQALPTREMGYEELAAIVTARVDGWTRIRLEDRDAWLADSTAGRFEWYSTLVAEGLAYLADTAPVPLAAIAGGAPGPAAASRASVRVTKTADVAGVLWFEVEVLRGSPCGDDPDPPTVQRGWLRAHDAAGEPRVWFHSRGC
jgi:hypothetical protein